MRRTSLTNAERNADEALLEETILADLWRQFNRKFPTEKECLEEIYRRVGGVQLLKCHYCGSQQVKRDCGERAFTCKGCNKESWFTAGTFFHHMKVPRAWLGAIWLMEHGQSVNSSRYKTLAGIAYSSALNILRKLAMVIENEMGEEALTVSSALLCPLVGKRSRETPARAHPLTEQEEIEKKELSNNGQDAQATNELSNLSGKEKEVYEALSVEPLHVDTLCGRTGMAPGELSASLVVLELDGLAKRMAGDRYIRQEGKHNNGFRADTVQSSLGTEKTTKLTKTISAIIDFVRLKFHRVSRKYVQNYLAVYWCYVDRARWKSGALLGACLRFRHISYKEILDYVSPVMVKIVLC